MGASAPFAFSLYFMGSKKSGRRPYSNEVSHKRIHLANARCNKQYSQKQVAEMCGISRSLYTKIETGLQDADESVWDQLAIIFGISKIKLKEIV